MQSPLNCLAVQMRYTNKSALPSKSFSHTLKCSLHSENTVKHVHVCACSECACISYSTSSWCRADYQRADKSCLNLLRARMKMRSCPSSLVAGSCHWSVMPSNHIPSLCIGAAIEASAWLVSADQLVSEYMGWKCIPMMCEL